MGRLHPRVGLCVFVRESFSHLVAYKLLHTMYLVLVYSKGIASAHMATFSDILDFIPVGAHCDSIDLPSGSTLDETILMWRRCLRDYLIKN